MSRATLSIDLNAIRYNLKEIQKAVKPAMVMAVLKANAYGLGMKAIAKVLDEGGVARFGVADVKESIKLRQITKKPIQILGELLRDEIPEAVEHGIICPASSLEIVKLIDKEAKQRKQVVKVQVLLDTGMGRLGIPHEECDAAIKAITKCSHIDIEGIYSHFPQANNPSKSINRLQIKHFKTITETYDFPIKHLANSDGINNLPDSYFNMVRTGINLFGVFDLLGHRAYTLKPSLTLETKLIACRWLKRGHPIGYGCTYKMKSDGFVGTLPIGYADGLPLGASNKGSVLIKGQYYKMIGRVSMDYTTIELGSQNVPLGTKIIVIGSSIFSRQGRKLRKQITVEDWAKTKSTHPYDIICSIGPRVERKYLK